MAEEFVVLTHEEFQLLPTSEKVEYLKRAVQWQRVLHAQLAIDLAKSIKDDLGEAPLPEPPTEPPAA